MGSAPQYRRDDGGRRRAGRWRRAALAALITGALVLPLFGAVRPETPAPAPASLAPLSASTLDEAYAANRANAAEAARTAAAHHDRDPARRRTVSWLTRVGTCCASTAAAPAG